MSTHTDSIGEPLSRYLHELATLREDALLAELRAVTAELPQARMQISVEQGVFLRMLVRMLGNLHRIYTETDQPLQAEHIKTFQEILTQKG